MADIEYTFRRGRGVPLIDPETGEAAWHPEPEARALIGKGFKPTTPERLEEMQRLAAEKAEYGESPITAGLVGAGRAASLGLTDVVGQALMGDEYSQGARALARENPTATFVGELGGGVAGGLIPGTPIARLGQVGRVAEEAVRGTAALGKAAGPAAVLARGVTEGAGFGVGSAMSELTLQEKPPTAEDVISTFERHLQTGAAFGGGLAVGVSGLAAAGRYAAEKLGLGKGARSLLARQAELTEQQLARQAGKEAELASLKAGALGEADARAMRQEMAEIEAEGVAAERAREQLARPGAPTAGPDSVDSAVKRLEQIRDYKKQVGAAGDEVRNARASVLDMRVKIKGLGPEPKAVKAVQEAEAAHPDLAKMAEEVSAVRSRVGQELPNLQDRLEAYVQAARGLKPEAAARIDEQLAKYADNPYGLMNSLAKERGSKIRIGPNTPAGSAGELMAELERGLGLPDFGAAGKELATAEYKLLHLGKQASRVWDLDTALEYAQLKRVRQQTWADFTRERMGASMKEAGGDHGAAMKKLGEEWRAMRAASSAEVAAEDPLRTSTRTELKQKLSEAQERLLSAQAKAAQVKARFETPDEFGNVLKLSEEASLEGRLAAVRRGTGKEARYQELKAALDNSESTKARIKELQGETADEAAANKELQSISERLSQGRAGLLGRIARRSTTRQLAKGIATGMGGGSLSWSDPIRSSVAIETARALAPKLVTGLKALIDPSFVSTTVGGIGGAVIAAGKRVGRVLGPGIKQEAIRALSHQDYEDTKNDLAQDSATYETTMRAATMGMDEGLRNRILAQHVRQRDFLLSKMPKDPREALGTPDRPAIPTGPAWKPSLAERQRFAIYKRSAEHWKHVIEDLVARRATAESMETLRTVYPEVAQALRLYVQNGVREAKAKGLRFGTSEARMLDLVLGPPYQLNQHVAFFQTTFRAQPRREPTRGQGSARLEMGKSLMNQLQQAQAGLTR